MSNLVLVRWRETDSTALQQILPRVLSQMAEGPPGIESATRQDVLIGNRQRRPARDLRMLPFPNREDPLRKEAEAGSL